MVKYRLPEALESLRPPVLAWGVAGKRTALAWARLEDRTWQNVCVRNRVIPPAAPTILRMPGLAPGSWHAEVWDTWGQGVVAQQSVVVNDAGEATIRLPAMARDWAVRLRR